MRKQIFGAIAGLVAAVLLVNCGGDNALTLEEYFDRLQEFSDEQMEASDESQAAFDATFEDEDTDEDDFIKAFQEFIKGLTESTKDSLDKVEGLRPPQEIEAVHDEFVAKLTTLVDVFEDFREELDDVDSEEELFAALETLEPAEEAASSEFEAACVAMEMAASDNGVSLDLDCSDEDDE